MAASAGVTRTTCPYCGVGCGVLARAGQPVKGDPEHPANLGRLCSKGSALSETVGLEGRLLHPEARGQRITWDDAIARVARAFSEAAAEHGPDSTALYVSGQLLTEDYYIANKLMKGYIGTANIDTNSRLCMASSVAGHKRAFGSDTVPGTYEDLEQADMVVLVGSNLAWCHPVLYQRLAAAKAKRGIRVVTVDPRRTATADLADYELRLAPGSDAWLFNGLLAAIEAAGALDPDYAAHLDGAEEALAAARDATLARVATETGLALQTLTRFYTDWIATERVVTVYSQGINQSASGTDKVSSILNTHLVTGRIGRVGSGPFSVTGQPNAMGGREVGGLANMLACHLEIENPAHRSAVQGFWASPTISTQPGLKAIDLFRACADGRIKALWIMSTNPAVSLPEADAVRAAIEAVPFVAVSDIIARTDTTALADVVLPASGWGEKSGTVTNSDRTISRQRAFLPTPGEARPDWKIICDVGRAMGWEDAFAHESPAAVFREYAALSGVAGALGRDFDISALAEIDDTAYDRLAPVRWPVSATKQGGRFFADGRFYTPSGRAQLRPVAPRAPEVRPSAETPLILNTGRVRDHWHTLTRTARSARLSRHIGEPFAEVHPDDAARYGIGVADLVCVSNPLGEVVVRALLTERTPKGSVFVPMHWTDQFASKARVDTLVPGLVDPYSGQPESKAATVAIARFGAAWHGFAAVRGELAPPGTAYWARAKAGAGWQAELADTEAPADWEAFARTLFAAPEAQAITVHDSARQSVRVALIADGQVAGVLFAAPEPVEIARAHVVAGLAEGASAAALLAGRPGADRPDPGATVCACFDVGANTVLAAIEDGAESVEAIGKVLRAGTNCGSCRPELRALLERARPRLAAE
ncbi:MAG: molybdopterin-dependent oxidoreductase [Pseudomonadota bacterium]